MKTMLEKMINDSISASESINVEHVMDCAKAAGLQAKAEFAKRICQLLQKKMNLELQIKFEREQLELQCELAEANARKTVFEEMIKEMSITAPVPEQSFKGVTLQDVRNSFKFPPILGCSQLHFENTSHTLLDRRKMVAENEVLNASLVLQLRISDLNENNDILAPAYTLASNPVPVNDISTQADFGCWDHPQHVISAIQDDVNLGVNVQRSTEPLRDISSRKDGPFTVHTRMGRVLNGRVRFLKKAKSDKKWEKGKKGKKNKFPRPPADPISTAAMFSVRSVPQRYHGFIWLTSKYSGKGGGKKKKKKKAR